MKFHIFSLNSFSLSGSCFYQKWNEINQNKSALRAVAPALVKKDGRGKNMSFWNMPQTCGPQKAILVFIFTCSLLHVSSWADSVWSMPACNLSTLQVSILWCARNPSSFRYDPHEVRFSSAAPPHPHALFSRPAPRPASNAILREEQHKHWEMAASRGCDWWLLLHFSIYNSQYLTDMEFAPHWYSLSVATKDTQASEKLMKPKRTHFIHYCIRSSNRICVQSLKLFYTY